MTNPPEPMFISPADLADLAGHSRAAIQARWLRTNLIPFLVGGDGAPKVLRQTVVDRLQAEPTPSSDAVTPQCHLVEITDNWDKVNEPLMAELIGTTRRALERKRLSGLTPHGVWDKVDGRIMYSLKRYEAWLESRWVAFTPPEPIHKPRRGRKPNDKHVYTLV